MPSLVDHSPFARLKQSIRHAASRAPPSAFRDTSAETPRPSAESDRDGERTNSRLGFAKAFRRASYDAKDKDKDKDKEREREHERERLHREKQERKERARQEKERDLRAKKEKVQARRAEMESKKHEKDLDARTLWKPFVAPTLSKASMSSPTLHLLVAGDPPAPITPDMISSPRQRKPSAPTRPSPIRIQAPATPIAAAHTPPASPDARRTDHRSPPPSPSPAPRPTANGLTRHPNLSSSSVQSTPPSSPLRRTRSPSPAIQSALHRDPELQSLIQSASRVLIKHLCAPNSKAQTPSSPTKQKEAEQVDMRMKGLVRLENRYWRPSASPTGGASAGDERERRYFVDALKDGYVLVVFINLFLPSGALPLRPSVSNAHRNIPRFLAHLQMHFQDASSSSQTEHVPAFLPDDLHTANPQGPDVESQFDGLKRVANCIIALGRLCEPASLKPSAPPARNPRPPPPIAYNRHGAGSVSSPDLTLKRSRSPSSPPPPAIQKRWTPPMQTREQKKEVGPSQPRRNMSKEPPDREKPPLPPQEAGPEDKNGAVMGADRSSVATTATAATYLSSIFSAPDRNSTATKFDTIRTVATNATSVSASTDKQLLEEPIALSAVDPERRRSLEMKRGRRLSEQVPPIDLGRVAEEAEDSTAGAQAMSKHKASPPININLGKGKWPDDFMDVFSPNPGASPSTAAFPISGSALESDSSGSERKKKRNNKCVDDGHIDGGIIALDSTSAPQSSSPLNDGILSSSPRRALRIRRASTDYNKDRGKSPGPVRLGPGSSATNVLLATEMMRETPYGQLATTPPRQAPLASSPPRIRAVSRPRVDSQPTAPPTLLPKSPNGSSLQPSSLLTRGSSQPAVPVSPSSSRYMPKSRKDHSSEDRVRSTTPLATTADRAADPLSGDGPVPFPRRSSGEPRRVSVDRRRSSGEHGRSGLSAQPGPNFTQLPTLASSSQTVLPTTLQPSKSDQTQPSQQAPSGAQRPPLSRGRFQSEISGAHESERVQAREDVAASNKGTRGRGRSGSLVNLGSEPPAAASMIRARTTEVDGGIRKTVIVKEDGRPPTHYQLGNCIGRGQFGSVYRALNLNTGQTAAVKRISLAGLQDQEIDHLMNEVTLLKQLAHPSIVKYEGMSRDNDTLSIVLEYVENGSLLHTLKAFGRLNERLVASYVIKILEGLHYLHGSGVVHCDLKAANILTTKNGNVKLSDFGVSLNLRAMENIKGDVAGTPNWMAPEVIELKGASTASDIWSLGCTVVELLTGKPPYADVPNGMTVLFRIVDDERPPIPDTCSDNLRNFLLQCFQKDPSKRPNAEILFEHPWLKMAWGANKDLRPQDSIPFLRRVSAELQRADLVRQFSVQDLAKPPDSPTIDTLPTSEELFKVPGKRRSSGQHSQANGEGDMINSARQTHSFVKTTFSKAVVCHVCQLAVKSRAVLCQDCGLIAHSRCAENAPGTCDIRTQLLLYAQLSQETSPPMHTPPLEHPVPNPSPKAAEHSLLSSPSITGLPKLFSRKRSKQGNSTDAIPTDSTNGNACRLGKDEDSTRRHSSLFAKGRTTPSEGHSRRTSMIETPNSSSLRSAADSARDVNISGPFPPPPPAKSRLSFGEHAEPRRASRMTASSADPSPDPQTADGPLSVELTTLARRRKRLSRTESQTSKGECVIQ